MAGLFDALVSVVIPLAAAFANSEAVARVLFDVLKGVAITVGYAVLAIGYFASAVMAGVYAMTALPRAAAAVLEGFAYVVDKINTELHIGALNDVYNGLINAAHKSNVAADMIAATAQELSPDMSAMQSALQDLTDLTYDEAAERARILALEKDAAEELTNVPQGFKVAAARFRAIAAEDYGTGVLGGASTGGSGGGNNFFIDKLEVMADDAIEAADAIERAAFQQTGTTNTKDSQSSSYRR